MAKLKLNAHIEGDVLDEQPPIVAPTVVTTLDRSAVVAAIRRAEAGCRHRGKDGSESRPEGLAQYCCIQGWPLDAAEQAFAHFAEHGWFAAGGNIWGVKPE